jgi:inorganic triphosphatase YgiF
MEIELKLALARGDVEALKRHPLLKAYALALPTEHELDDTYYDTPDLRILRSGAGLRVRQVAGAAIQTMKAGGSVEGGLHSRHEWESRVAGPRPELDKLRELVDAKGPWSKLLCSGSLEDALTPVFTVRLWRTLWVLQLPEGSEVEFVLDQGDIESRGRRLPVSEIELELKAGTPAHLFDFALALQKDLPFQIAQSSKAERGYGLFEPRPWKAVKAGPVELAEAMTVEQAAQAIIGNCLQQIQANQPGVAECRDARALRQMRAGLRRLHCALEMMTDVIDLPQALGEELDWLAGELGAARDWDVLAGSTLPALTGIASGPVAENAAARESEAREDTDGLPPAAGQAGGSPQDGAAPDDENDGGAAPEVTVVWDGAPLSTPQPAAGTRPLLADLRQAAQREADKMRERASAAVTGPRYTALVLGFMRWFLGREWRVAMPPAQQSQLDSPVRRFAQRLLERQHKRLLKRGRKLQGAQAGACHRVRVAAKKSRYATGFFQALHRKKKVRRFVAALTRLQDELQWANDAVVAERLLQELRLAQEGLSESAAYACGYLAAQLQGSVKRIGKHWRRFRDVEPPS